MELESETIQQMLFSHLWIFVFVWESLKLYVCVLCPAKAKRHAPELCHSFSDSEFKSSSLQPPCIWGKRETMLRARCT